jgi:uroporphyrinogen-III synthase
MFVPHPRIAAHARAAGFTRVIETPPGDDGLLGALEAHFLLASVKL